MARFSLAVLISLATFAAISATAGVSIYAMARCFEAIYKDPAQAREVVPLALFVAAGLLCAAAFGTLAYFTVKPNA